MMNYEEALNYIHTTERFGSKPGLIRIEALLEAMGNPHRRLRFVHVAGTNGKGSTCAAVCSILMAAGYKTGLYISPYIYDFCERIEIGREMIPRDVLAARVTRIKETIDRLVASGGPQPTEFEIITAMAMQYFADMGCDIVVLEVGLGGRWDATNVIPAPEAAAITSISLDHTQYLGSTLPEIAGEKCGIIKPGCRVVTHHAQDDGVMEVIRTRCTALSAPLRVTDGAALIVHDIGCRGSRVTYRGMDLVIPLIGAHQIQNALIAVELALALREGGRAITDEHIAAGIADTRWPGRLEPVMDRPLIFLDGAHNPGGIEVLCQAIDTIFAGRRLICLMGMMGDKDVSACVTPIARRASVLIAIQSQNPRAIASASIAQMASGQAPEVYDRPNITDAAALALSLAGPDDMILACGSLMQLGEVKEALLKAANP